MIAGEASGDLHGANLIKAMQNSGVTVEVRAWGGDLMEKAGADLRKHFRDLAFMGFWEVLKNIRTIFNNLDFCKKDILEWNPDVLVLIDYPGFNLRIARWAKKKGIKVVYYISPQIWAWHTSRVHQIKRDVDKMIVILPFEKDFYARYGMEVDYVGHPLLDALETPSGNNQTRAEWVALLPGSRAQELQRILPVMLSVAPLFPELTFLIARAPSVDKSYFQPFLDGHSNVHVFEGHTYELLQKASAALVKSGTSTLETALIGTPQVVCYKGSSLSFWIAKKVVEVKFISLVNLILDMPLVTELIQDDCNTQQLSQELKALLHPKTADEIKAGYAELREKLGGGGASERAAAIILGV